MINKKIKSLKSNGPIGIKNRIAFLGAGNMAEALINGLINSGLVSPSQITASDIRNERLAYLKKKFKVNTTRNNREASEKCDVIFLAVKPQQLPDLLKEIKPVINHFPLIVSIAAGITSRFIEKNLKQKIPVIRAMPNTPALVGAGAIAISKGQWVKKTHFDLVFSLFSTVGMVVSLPENKINSVTALSGSGPAYVFRLCEAMQLAGVKMGLSRKNSEVLARRTIYGAGKMLFESMDSAAVLRRRVTSPGGTTEAAINYFESRDFSGLIENALNLAHKRAEELSK